MKLLKLPVLLLAAAFWYGCSDQTTIYQDDLQDQLVLEVNPAVLAGAIQYEAAGVLEIHETGGLTGKGADSAGDYPLTVIASVAPPSYKSGDALTASHVDIEGNYAYVAYNTVGDEYFGAVDVIAISDPHNPRVASRLFYLNADLNSVRYDNGFLYLAGGMDAEASVRATSNSFLARIRVDQGRLDTRQISYAFQPGFNATDIQVLDDRILVSSGKDGTVSAYDKSGLSLQGETYIPDARSIARIPGGIAVLDAGTGIRLLDPLLNETSVIPVATELGPATKKTLDADDLSVWVAEASRGAGRYSLETGELIEYLEIPIHPEGVSDSDIVTNAVVANAGTLFMANGGAGLSLAESAGATGSEQKGIMELEGSVNYIASSGDYLFAASGTGGLQIIRLNRAGPGLAASCEDLPEYDGRSQIIVNSGESVSIRGEKQLNSISVGGFLLLCGSWTVSNHINIQPGGNLSLYGMLAVGRFSSRRNITVGEGSTLRIEGDATIYGDLILQDGARVEFLGAESEIDIFGAVKYQGYVEVTGTFRDVRGRF